MTRNMAAGCCVGWLILLTATVVSASPIAVLESRAGVWIGTGHGGPPEVGVVEIRFRPRRAHLILDQREIGTGRDFDGSPGYLLLRPGNYQLTTRLGGYHDAAVQLKIEAGRHYEIRGRLHRAPGQEVERWWDQDQRDGGEQRLFSPRGEGSETRAAGPDLSLRPDLQLDDGEAPVVSTDQNQEPTVGLFLSVLPANASVYLDGQFLGVASEIASSSQLISVAPGEHVLEVLAPGHEPQRRVIRGEGGQRVDLVVDLTGQTGQ